ncbi:MAG: HDOD domain-containing protein [Phycisphaeraceae bacterium]|nr:HDOD domain-containing protein [Phycisphaeraceae bacterium]
MNQELLDKVLKSPRLPSLPTIALEVIDLVQQRDVNIKQIANTIQHDPALTSKILRTVNSSFYGQAHSVGTISHALVVLGLNSVKTLALGFSLVGNLSNAGGDGFDHMAFWKRSLYSAAAARALAKQVGIVQQEESFLGGLLQDLGMLALNQALGEPYQNVLAQVGVEHRQLILMEQDQFGADHAEIGGALAEQWHLPPMLTHSIRYHEDPIEAPEDMLAMIYCVALGGRAADVFISESPGEALDNYYRLAETWFHMPQEQSQPLLTAIHKNTVEMKHLFDLPTGDLGNADGILARANDALLNLSMQQQQQTAELQAQNQVLVEQATKDPLTGAANRRRFNDFIAEQFRAATDGAGPLSILFMDVDHFKKFNDTYGHQTGDRVLVEVAGVLTDKVGDTGLVARYGGEEFAVILPRMDRVSAARKAEELRGAIERNAVTSDEGKALTVTVSIGVATHDGTFFTSAEQFIRAADQGVYAAKGAGRNCVRVFAPRPKKVA